MILNKVKNIWSGTTKVQRVYIGQNIVWQYAQELPDGYRRLKYLESSGCQYIDTQFRLATDRNNVACVVIPTKVHGTHSSGYNGIAGENSSPQLGLCNTGWTVGNANSEKPYLPQIGVKYKLEYSKNYMGDYYVDGQDTGLRRAGVLTVKLFYVESKPANVYIKLFSAISSTKEENLNFNLIPALDPQGKPCLYDLVTKQTFYNEGSGEFGYEFPDGSYVAPQNR